MNNSVPKAPLARGMTLLCAVLAFFNPFIRAAAAVRPSILAFNVAAEATINLGTTTSLNWGVADATTVTLSPGFGDVTNLDHVDITPTVTTTYVLTATNSAGSVSRSKKITVIVPPAIQSFTATPGSINAGASVILGWSAPGATWFYVAADSGDDPGQLFSTSVTVKPKVTTTYTLTSHNTAGTDVKTLVVPVAPPLPKPAIDSFTASPASVAAGNSTTLTWAVTGATALSITPGIGVVTGTSLTITPTASTTYTLIATNSSGSVSKKIPVTVTAPLPLPVINSFAATPPSITAGTASTLNWSVSGADSLAIAADVGASPGAVTGTSLNVTPAVNTTYTLIARNATGSVTRTVPVAVTVPAPVINSFTATQGAIFRGGSTTLNWSVSGADSLTISPGIGAVTGTSLVVSPVQTTTYTLTASNGPSSVAQNVTITVTVPPPVINSFVAAPATILKGESTTMTWAVDGADTLAISPAIGAVTGTSRTVTPPSSVNYILTATNAGGSVTKSAFVTVNQPDPLPVINSFTAALATITTGDSTTLNWDVTGAASVSIAASTGASPGVVTGNSVVVSPTASTTYTLTATNTTGGSVTQTATVAVTATPPVISSFTASPGTVTSGGSTVLSWNVAGAATIAISSDVGASPGVVTGTSVTVNPFANTTYTLRATSAGGGVATKNVTITVTDPAPVIGSFASIPNSIHAGETARIIWSVTGAATLNITASTGASPGVVTGTSGSIDVTPAVTTDYTLTATSPGGVVSHSLTEIQVLAAPPAPVPVISAFGALPGTIVAGNATTLAWSVSGADSVAIAADVGASPGAVTGSSLMVSPAATTTYTLTATNTFGPATKTAKVTVTGPTAPIIDSFAAAPAFIRDGQSTTLSWSISGADSVTIAADVGTGPGAVTGTSIVVSPTATTTYTLSAKNNIGTSTATVPVTFFTPGAGSVEHPRIWATPATVLALNARAAANDPAWLRLRSDCDAYVNMTIRFPDEDGTDNSISGGYEYNDYLKPSEELALGYLAAKTADPVRAAKYAAKERQLLLALSDPVRHGRPTTDSGYSIRSYVPALALGYDWIFETLSDADRVQIYTEINRWITSYEAEGFGRDYPQGNYFAGYYAAKALGALATEGENPSGPAMWNDWLNRVHYGMVQPYYAQWLSGGGAPDGWNYGPFETINMLRPLAAAFTAKGLDLIHDSAKPMAYHDGHVRWMTQFTWPDLITVSDRGFVYNSDDPTGADAAWATQFNGLLRLANGSNAPIMQRYTSELRTTQGTRDVEAWAEFLLHDNNAPSQDYRTALSYQTNGDGQVAMRSSWSTDAVWGAFQAGPYTGYPGSSEEFFDEGALTIQRGSVQFLVNTWGAMMRNTPGTNDGDPVFNDVYNELFQDQADGVHAGRRIFNTYYAVRPDGYWGQVESTPFDHSPTTLSRFEEGGSYVLMRGTRLEDQYFGDHPISGWTRTVAYLRPQLFVVYDRTTLKNANADNWMAWHVGPAPVARADSAAGTHTFDVIDTRAAFGGNLFRGRVTTVLPAGNTVTPVDVFGRGKVYRLEVRNSAPAAAATWLTVFDASGSAAAAGAVAPLTAAAGNVFAGAVEGAIITGANGIGTAILFSKTGAVVDGSIFFKVPLADTTCLLGDLQPGAGYTVTAASVGGSFSLQVTPGGTLPATAQGTLVFKVSATGTVTAP